MFLKLAPLVTQIHAKIMPHVITYPLQILMHAAVRRGFRERIVNKVIFI